MRTKTKLITALMLLVTLAGMSLLWAAEPEVLTLEQAVDLALKSNPDLQLAQNQIELANISLKQQKSNTLPELTLSANGYHQYAESTTTVTGRSTDLSFDLNATLNLFNGFHDATAIKVSKLEQIAAQKELSRSEQTVLFNTIQGYIQAVLAQEFIAVEEENLKAQQIQLQLIEDFYKAGRRPKADLFQQQAEIAGSELRLLDAQRNDQLRKLQLMLSLGRSPRADFQVQDPGIERLIKKLQNESQDRSVALALDQRPDLQARELDMQAAQTDIKVAAAGYWPKLSFYTDLSSNYNNIRSINSFSSQLFDHNLNAAVGLSLSIPVFDRWQTKNSVASASVQYNNRQVEWDKARLQISLDVQQAQAEFLTAAKQIQVSDSQMIYSQQALESIEARYKVNSATMAELIQARAQLLDARYNWLEARFNMVIRGMALDYAGGDGQSMLAILHSIQGENK
jgi:outer membrane protein